MNVSCFRRLTPKLWFAGQEQAMIIFIFMLILEEIIVLNIVEKHLFLDIYEIINPFIIKTFQINILSDNDTEKVMTVLNEMAQTGLIEIKNYNWAGIAPNNDQLDEIIDESELAPYYSAQEVRDILKM